MVKHLRLITLLALVLLLPTAVFTSHVRSQVPKEDAHKILQGFCDGLDIDADINEAGYDDGDDIADVITLLSAENNRFAVKGIKKLGNVLTSVPMSLENKGGNEGADTLYLTKLQELATNLQNVKAYDAADSNNFTILGVSIVDLVNTATNQLNGGQFYDAGWSMGTALSKMYTATQPPISEDVIAEVQAKAEEQGWTPGEVSEELTGFATIDDFAKAKLGVSEEGRAKMIAERRRLRRRGMEPKAIHEHRQSYPASFDTRTKWPNCIHGIRDQGTCGSCWAFAATTVINDRFCIASGGKINKYTSPQQMVECDPKSNGCGGGNEIYAFQYMQKNGIFQESCFPYSSTTHDSGRALGRCPSKCNDGSAPNKLYVTNPKQFGNDNDIKYELTNFGPVTTGMTVYQDFQSYKGGIYSHVSGGKAGAHAIRIIGWGTDSNSGRQYWIVANSWGTNWGEKGYFRIRMGDSDIGSDSSTATPDLTRSITTNNNGADIPGEDAGGSGVGGQEFGGGGGGGQPDQPDLGGDDYGGDTGGGDDGSGDWGNWDDWGSDGGNNDGGSDWGNWDDWGSDWGNNDGGSGDWGNWDDWGSDWGNNNGGDDWGSWDDWGNGGDDWGNSDDWGSGGDDWSNWGWRRNSKSGVISQGIRRSVHRKGPRPVRKNPTTPNRPPFRRKSPTKQRRRRSIPKSARFPRKLSTVRAKTVTVRKPEGVKSIEKQVHHLNKH